MSANGKIARLMLQSVKVRKRCEVAAKHGRLDDIQLDR